MIRTLLITGDDIGPWHSWQENADAIKTVLRSSDKFDLRVSEDDNILESKRALDNYDLIVFVFNNSGTVKMTFGVLFFSYRLLYDSK